MPDADGPTTWTPKRGRVFKVIAWVLVSLITLGAVAGLVMMMLV